MIVALAGPGLGCGKYGPPIRSEYPVPTVPDWVVVPEPPPDPAAAPGAVAPQRGAAPPSADGAAPAADAPEGESQP